jgi:hypothetical protein
MWIGTRVLGMYVVADYRKAIASGQITREQASEIRASNPGDVYSDRALQSTLARTLFDLTGDIDHYMTDPW